MTPHPWFPMIYKERRPEDRHGQLGGTVVGEWRLGDGPPLSTATTIQRDTRLADRHLAWWRETSYCAAVSRPTRQRGA